MIKLNLSSNENNIILSGVEVNKINKRILFHLKRTFNAIENEDGIVIPSFQNENILSDLTDFLSKKGIELSLDSNAKDYLKEMFDEEISFKVFSEKAKAIWNNDLIRKEFEDFCNVLDSKLSRKLYPLQLLASYHLAFSQNACNFSVPGAGKTSIVYGTYSYLKNLPNTHKKHVDKLLVIGPLSSFGPWENEYNECFDEIANVRRISGNISSFEEKKRYFFSRNVSEITLMSYQGIINQKKNLEFFLKHNNVMIVLDEAHKIKNTDGGIIAETILELASLAKSRVVLTGTPSPNGYRDLYNLFKFIWPNKDLINFSLNQLDDMSKNIEDPRIEILVEDISPYFVRIKKKDLGLPDKIENPPINVPMDDMQKLIYSVLENKTIKELIKDEEVGIVDNLKKAKVIRLIQAATNPYLLLKPIQDSISGLSIKNFDDEELLNALKLYEQNKNVPPKFSTALKIINGLISKNEKVIVWAVFIDTVERFAEYLADNGVNCKILYGKTRVESDDLDGNIETREKIIRDFHSNESEFKVIIANPFAVAESISLHKACHNAIYLERNFDAARFVQSKDRIHRYGLEFDTVTNYYYLLTENSIDTVIDERLKQKENLMINLTENSDIPLFQVLDEDIDESDIKALINNYVKQDK